MQPLPEPDRLASERIAPQAPFWVTAAACAIMVPIAWFKFVLPKTQIVPGDKKEPA